MTHKIRKPQALTFVLASTLLLFPALVRARDTVLGKIQFGAVSADAKTAGVWVDGEYVGYLSELKGSKSILLLPGQHNITVREDGYQSFNQDVMVHPGETEGLCVSLTRAPTAPLPPVLATVKTAVDPSRAAVFVDGLYIGHAGEFGGMGRGMLVAPGAHHVSIALAGYQAFNTEINPVARQTVQIKTSLVKSAGPLSEPLVEKGTENGKTAASLAH